MAATQLTLFQREEYIEHVGLDASLWHGSYNSRESSFHQLSPYVGKMKSGMARVLVSLYSKPGDTVLDPFSGSGVVPLEAALLKREAWANDLSPYAYALTRAKLDAPAAKHTALHDAKAILELVKQESPSVDLNEVPDWVREFFHPDTLREVIVAFRLIRSKQNYFLMACLLGILHHVRPGFLSYPASHLVPYLRAAKYPRDQFPEMYAYRDLGSRLLAKVSRAYRRPLIGADWSTKQYHVWKENAMTLPIEDGTAASIVSSPPYYGALDYARDNRLRLWFLGCKDWKSLDSDLTANSKVYVPQMRNCLREMYRVLKPRGYCVLVLGDVERDGKIRRTAEILAEIAVDVSGNGFAIETIYDDRIPDERRSRRETKTTKFERILVMRKK
jgi:SAM-dependent methyltransferase